jgi:hypothetical protein
VAQLTGAEHGRKKRYFPFDERYHAPVGQRYQLTEFYTSVILAM